MSNEFNILIIFGLCCDSSIVAHYDLIEKSSISKNSSNVFECDNRDKAEVLLLNSC